MADRLPGLFELVPDALIVVDDTGRIVQANANAQKLFGYSQTGLAGLGIEALIPAGLRERHRQHRAAYMAQPRVRPMGATGQALIGQRHDGQQFPVEIALSPINSDGRHLYLASIRDVSESQRARQALVRARYDALVARTGQSALESTDENHIIQSLPPLVAEALAIDAVAVAFLTSSGEGLEIRAAFGFDGQWLDTMFSQGGADMQQALPSAQPEVIEDFSVPASARNSLFPPPWSQGSGALIPLIDRDRPMGVLIALSRKSRRFDHDALHLLQSVANLLAALVQRRRTEDQLAHSQRLDAIGQLTGGIAHDFNNLLTIISGNLQLLEAECSNSPPAKELIASALRSVTRGAELTAKLAVFARRQRLAPYAVPPKAALHEVGLMLQRTLGESIHVTINCPDALPAAYVDPTLLDTALVNLALNARDAMPRGGELTLAAQERWVSGAESRPDLSAGHYVLFRVEDTGLGMSPQTLSRAVDPFFTTKDIGRGSGLGLSMVYGFVRQSNGYLHIDSRLGYGTRVEIYLPVARADAVASPVPATSTAPGGGETILVVEDETDVRQVAEAFLQSLGYRTLAVADAAGALEQLEQDQEISMLFSDVMLGNGMDGNELATVARSLRPGLPVLLTTGYDEMAPRQQADGFALLRKPYRREQLAEAVRTSLERQ